MYYIISKKDTTLVTILTGSGELYNYPIDNFNILEKDDDNLELCLQALQEYITGHTEYVVSDSGDLVDIQTLYTTEYVRYLIDNSCALITNYDFRKEGIEYIKISQEEHNEFTTIQENTNVKTLKIKQMQDFWSSILVEINIPTFPFFLNGVENNSYKIHLPTTSESANIFQRLKFEPFYIEDAQGNDVFDDSGDFIKSNLSTAESEDIFKQILGFIDIVSNAIRRNIARINAITSLDDVNNFDIRTKGDGTLFEDNFFYVNLKKKVFKVINQNEISLSENELLQKELFFDINIQNLDIDQFYIVLPQITKNIIDVGYIKLVILNIEPETEIILRSDSGVELVDVSFKKLPNSNISKTYTEIYATMIEGESSWLGNNQI